MLSYEELLRRYTLLLQENRALKARLSASISEVDTDKADAETADTERADTERAGAGHDTPRSDAFIGVASPVNMHSSPEEKIKLFRSLFIGREDVFARRWQAVASGKSGYQPVCGNEWAQGLCDKATYKCAVCPNRKLLPLTDRDIYNHLSGRDAYARDVIGMYPMLPDETCLFLCADFDEASYEEDVTAFREVCAEKKIPVSVERSRSGNGAHAWIFFSEPIPAADARRLASGILTAAMERRGELSFKSYDRLFPNQDTMPAGGFGNLIALPLQGMAKKNGNSVFVDERFVAYADQWAYLCAVSKLDKEDAVTFAAAFSKRGELGVLVSESDEKPWETKKKATVCAFDFPPLLNITESNMLYIPTASLSPAAKNTVKRLAAFRNPDFYRAQAMRLPIYNKPRIICTAELTDSYIGIPRGCKEALCELLEQHSVPYAIEDKTNAGAEIPVIFSGTLRDEQQPAADAMLEKNTGVLSATTAFGKTVIASYMISRRKVNTLVLVHTAALMEQWKKSLEQFLIIDIASPETPKGRGRKKAWSPVGQLGSGKNTLHGVVDVAIMQSLFLGDDVKELVRGYGMVIVDECHHVSAVNFEKILSFANARYVYGLTATPTRQDGHHPIVFMQCGAIRYRVDARAQADNRSFAHSIIPRFTAFHSEKAAEKSIVSLYRELAENEARNSLIVRDVVTALNCGRTPILMTERREHALNLAAMMSGHCKNVITLLGTPSSKERREVLARLEAIPDREPLVVIATGKYVGEGFDCPRLDTLFLALPIAWKGKVAQYAGRLHRDYTGKNEVQIYDYADIHIPVLERMYQKRVKSYAAIGYKTKLGAETAISPDIIYDGKSFYSVFCKDIESASREVLLVSPFMRKNRLTQIAGLLQTPLANGVSVTVVTRPPENFKEAERDIVTANAEFLKQRGINVRFKTDFHQKFAIFDRKLVWYGSVNLLSFGKYEESIMRFENGDIAGQLMDTVI